MARREGDVVIRRRPIASRSDSYRYTWGSVDHLVDWDKVLLHMGPESLELDDLDELIGCLQMIRQEILRGQE